MIDLIPATTDIFNLQAGGNIIQGMNQVYAAARPFFTMPITHALAVGGGFLALGLFTLKQVVGMFLRTLGGQPRQLPPPSSRPD